MSSQVLLYPAYSLSRTQETSLSQPNHNNDIKEMAARKMDDFYYELNYAPIYMSKS
jgi:hypothetical protein